MIGTTPGEAGGASHRATWRGAAVWGWTVAAAAAVSWLLLAVALRRPEAVAAGDAAAPVWRLVGGGWWVALLSLSGVAAGFPRLAQAPSLSRLRSVSPGFLLRLTALALLAALAAATAAAARVPGAQRALVEASAAAALALVLAVTLALLAVRPELLSAPRRAWARVLDAAALNLVAVLLVAELAVALAARVSSSPLLHFDRVFGSAGGEQAVRENLRRFRLKPGTPFFDASVNSRGYVDDEFFVAGRRDLVVAVLADSFGVGVVPMSYNFTAVAERALQRSLGSRYERVAVHNFGVASISPPEYYYLLVNEVLPTSPALVVLCLFVGNDLGAPLARSETSLLTLQSWRGFQLARRLVALGETHGGGAVEFTDWGRFESGVPEWVLDHRLERPTFREERFLEIERERVGECNLGWPELTARHARICATLGEFHRVLGDRLLVAIVPDEYQVSDELWRAVLGTVPDPASLRREYPQQQLLECCRRAGIQALDLLPPLREAQRDAPTYHLRDTHWNARGNRVAGEAIAAWLLAHRSP